MKTSLKYAAMLAIASVALSSCSADEEIFDVKGEGTVFISASLNTDVKPASRASLDEIREKTLIWLANEKGVVRQYKGLKEIPAEGVRLLSGEYTAYAWSGDSTPASWEDRYFKGSTPFTIANGDKKALEITCKIANTVVAVNYDEKFDEVLTDYTMTVGHSQGELTFEGRTDAQGYFMMNSRDKDLNWTLRGTLPNGEEYVRVGKIEACKPATRYTLSIKCSDREDEEVGGAYFTVEIDESEDVSDDNIVIIAPPEIRGINGLNLDEPLQAAKGEFNRASIWITASTKIKSLHISSDYLADVLGLVEGSNTFDLLNMSDTDLYQRIIDAGITYVLNYDENQDASSIKLSFDDEKFLNQLGDGEYSFAIKVDDVNGKSATATLNVVVSDAPVSTVEVAATDVWATKATITGTVNKEGVTGAVMSYRAKGTMAWTDAETTESNGKLSAVVTGLNPSTAYEFAARADGFEGKIMSFTTEATAQLPNSGFEDWYVYSSKLWMPVAEGEAQFWDSGNSALKSMLFIANLSKNPTSKDETVKHGGAASARLRSISTAGVLAAGNIFAGEFIRTEGTNGVLGWGQQWTARPAKLKGWYRYEPQAVTSEKADYDALKKGDMDKGIVYIALLDNSVVKEDSGKKYPVIIKNKASERQLFDKNASNVIAYGEIVFEGTTEGSGMVEFEIPITYRRTDVIPSYIMCTASASIGGDYYVGGENSTLWIDDLELVY